MLLDVVEDPVDQVGVGLECRREVAEIDVDPMRRRIPGLGIEQILCRHSRREVQEGRLAGSDQAEGQQGDRPRTRTPYVNSTNVSLTTNGHRSNQ